MAKKMKASASFALFDVVYEDGSQRSNRRVALGELDGHNDPLKAAEAVLAQQDRDISQKSGTAPARIKAVMRSGKK